MPEDWREGKEDQENLRRVLEHQAREAERLLVTPEASYPRDVADLERYIQNFQDTAEPFPEREPEQGAEGGTEAAYGRVVSLLQGPGADIVNSQVTLGIQTPVLRASKQWVVTVKPLADIPPQASFAGFLNVNIQYTIGGATFQKYLRMTGNIARSFPVFGRSVIVSLQLVSDPATAPHALQVAVAVAPGTLPGPERYNGTWWNTYGQAVSNNYGLWTTGLNTAAPNGVPGVLMAYSIACSNLGGAAALYPMFFDLPTLASLGAGFAPIHTGMVLTSAPQTASFDDEFDPSLFFQDGLIFAFSSTPRLYTAVVGAAGTLEYKIGQ